MTEINCTVRVPSKQFETICLIPASTSTITQKLDFRTLVDYSTTESVIMGNSFNFPDEWSNVCAAVSHARVNTSQSLLKCNESVSKMKLTLREFSKCVHVKGEWVVINSIECEKKNSGLCLQAIPFRTRE